MKEYKFVPDKLYGACLARAGVLNQGELAAKAGITPGMLSDWCRGVKEPKVNSLAKVAGVMDVPMDHFFDWVRVKKGDKQ